MGLPPGYQPAGQNGNGSEPAFSNTPTRQLLELIASRLAQPSAGPVTLNVSPAGGEGKSSAEITEGAKGELRINLKAYAGDESRLSSALDAVIEQYKRWVEAKRALQPPSPTVPPPTPASTPPASNDTAEALTAISQTGEQAKPKPKRAKKEAA